MQLTEAIQTISNLSNEITEDLNRYTEQESPKPYIIKKLNNQINKLDFVINLITEHLTQEEQRNQKRNQAAKQRTQEREKLELICLLHGIFDLDYYMNLSLVLLKDGAKNSLNPKPTIRNYIKAKITPKLESLILEIEHYEKIKTIQKPIGHILQEGEKPKYLGTTDKPVTKF